MGNGFFIPQSVIRPTIRPQKADFLDTVYGGIDEEVTLLMDGIKDKSAADSLFNEKLTVLRRKLEKLNMDIMLHRSL